MAEVLHLEAENKFTIEQDGHLAELKYKLVEEGVLEMYSTYVPDELRGQKIAQSLAESALNYARRKNLKVIPSCWFVEKYIAKNPQFKDLLN